MKALKIKPLKMKHRLNELAEQLQAHSKKVNLFSKQDRELLLEKHFPDALEVLEVWRPVEGQRALDLGTGGGIPGLVLAASVEGVDFDLMDSVEKKLAVLEEVVQEMDLSGVLTLVGRFEDLAHEEDYRSQYDAVFARAVCELSVLLEYAAGFLKVGGRLYAWKGPKALEEVVEAENAMQVLNLELVEKHDYVLAGGEQRWILTFEKKGETMEKYPRKVGVPQKKPL